MKRGLFIQSLREEIQNLNNLVESLSDGSNPCFPYEYDCSEHFHNIVVHLRKVEKEIKRWEPSQSGKRALNFVNGMLIK